MKSDNQFTLVERTVADAADYSQLQLDKVKLRLLDNFSTVLNSILSMVIVILVASLSLMGFSVAAIVWIGGLIGSYVIAMLIVAGLLLIAAGILYGLRNKLFINKIVQMMAKVMFTPDNADDNEEPR